MKKTKKKAKIQESKVDESKGRQQLYKLVGRMICADDYARERAQEYIKDESYIEQEKKWKQLLKLVSCGWTEYAEQVKQSNGDCGLMLDLQTVWVIRCTLGIDMPGYIPFSYD